MTVELWTEMAAANAYLRHVYAGELPSVILPQRRGLVRLDVALPYGEVTLDEAVPIVATLGWLARRDRRPVPLVEVVRRRRGK